MNLNGFNIDYYYQHIDKFDMSITLRKVKADSDKDTVIT